MSIQVPIYVEVKMCNRLYRVFDDVYNLTVQNYLPTLLAASTKRGNSRDAGENYSSSASVPSSGENPCLLAGNSTLLNASVSA